MKDTLLLVVKDYTMCENGLIYSNKLAKGVCEEYIEIMNFDLDTKTIIDVDNNDVLLSCYDLIVTNNPSVLNRIKPKYSIIVTKDIKILSKINKDLNVFQVNDLTFVPELIDILYELNEKMWNEKGESLCY